MAYKALYRTYRPKSFEEVAGQEHITTTFKNALVQNKLAHAYLFSGPRGTGKTSVAKIIAKAVNCVQAPVSNPCNECDICVGIDQNTINDVIEIDAASNNGVDEIREIRDKVKYLPGVGKFKVYIIDEVHMLSTGAFNALLKTLEEPPKHVIFILATTEPHKIPLTIHSRCQRFDFRGIGTEDMIAKLEEIIEKESISIDKPAVDFIAECAEGGLRDAISLLDQVNAYSEKAININDIHAIRGSIAHQDMLNIAQAIESEDVVIAIGVMDDLISSGKESSRLLDDLIRFYRDILVYKHTAPNQAFNRLFKNETFQEFAKAMSSPRVFYYLDILHETKQTMRYVGGGKLHLEIAFMKMSEPLLKKETIAIERIETLEKRIESLDQQMKTQKEKDLLAETPQKETTTLSTEPPKPDEIEPKPKKTEPQRDKKTKKEKESVEQHSDSFQTLYDRYHSKPYKTFDIQYVEDVLHTGDREAKIDMVKKWYDLERYVEGDALKYAQMVTSGNIVATNGTMLLVAYDNFPICNRLMSADVKKKVMQILESYYKRKIMFMALPEEIWDKISKEFIKKFRHPDNEDTFIKLSPINHPKLKEIPAEKESFTDVESDSAKEAKALFGDIVKIKREGE